MFLVVECISKVEIIQSLRARIYELQFNYRPEKNYLKQFHIHITPPVYCSDEDGIV